MDRILAQESPEEYLPTLRDDLEIVKGAPLANGAPTWVIFDPVSDKYYEIGRETLDQLSMWSVGTISKLKKVLCSELGRDVSADEIKSTIHFLITNSLLRDIPGGDFKSLVANQESRKKSSLSKMAHGYLFFRIPLFRPDRFLRFMWPFVRPLFSKTAVLLFFLTALCGLYLTSRQWDHFIGTFQYMLSVDGMMLYGLSLILVKSLHELGHAFMATKFGLRVPTIGVAFIVLMPILYTDTTAAWRLPSRRKRLMIDAAGIFTELAIASVATILWVFLPDGGLRLAVFTIATTSWISSLAVNLNPLMRFDGYYILSDALGFQNLQERGFDMARWRLRELLFDIGEKPPELLTIRMRRIVVLHAWATWIYRFFLFAGIAVLVYAFFIKVVGILLFALEIIWFIILPVFRELKRWWAMKSLIVKTKRSLITFGVLVVLVAAFTVPWSTRISIPSILVAEHEFKLYPPYPAKLVEMNVREGQEVHKGDLLFRFEAPELAIRLFGARERGALLQARINRIGSDEGDRTARIVLLNELETTRKELRGIKKLAAELQVRAGFDGRIVDLDPELKPGMWVNAKNPLALIHGNSGFNVKGYVQEASLRRFDRGAAADFIPEDPALARIPLRVETIAYAGAKHLDEPYLALRFGGSIPTSDVRPRELAPKNSIFAVYFQASMDAREWQPQKVVRGSTIIRGRPESLYKRVKRGVLSVLVREAGI